MWEYFISSIRRVTGCNDPSQASRDRCVSLRVTPGPSPLLITQGLALMGCVSQVSGWVWPAGREAGEWEGRRSQAVSPHASLSPAVSSIGCITFIAPAAVLLEPPWCQFLWGAPSLRAPLPPSPLSHQPKGVSGFLKLLISLSPVRLLSCILNSLRCIPFM